jgi:hypothetical protein
MAATICKHFPLLVCLLRRVGRGWHQLGFRWMLFHAGCTGRKSQRSTTLTDNSSSDISRSISTSTSRSS